MKKKKEDKHNDLFNRAIDKITGSTPFDIASDNEEQRDYDLRSSLSIVTRNVKFVLFVTILAVAYIQNRMVCERQFAQIDKLNKELVDIKYISMITEAELLETGRPDIIKSLVDKNNLNLVEQDCPPYKVIFNGE